MRHHKRAHRGALKRFLKCFDALADIEMLSEDLKTELYSRTLGWLGDGRRVVAGLLVESDGSSPLDPGAVMLIDDHGNVEGSVTGGCVEGAVVQEAQDLLEGGLPRVVTYGISDELAGTVGLMCGGTVRIFIHELTGPYLDTVTSAIQALADDRPAAIATLLDGEHAGAKLAVIDDEVIGSFGGPELLDQSVARDAHGLLEQGHSGLRRYGSDGATMGGDLRVFVDVRPNPPQMVIFGAIDFSAALAPAARALGYSVTICDAREAFIRSPRFSRAAEVAVDWPDRFLAGRRLGPRDAVLVFTHDSKFDEPAIISALSTGAGYIGALGSRRTVADRNRRLREAGVTDADIERLFQPCGIDIGARGPEETAISILAEIIAKRTGRGGESLRRTEESIHAAHEVSV